MSSEPFLAACELPVVRPGHFVRSNALYHYWTLTKPEINFLIGMATASAFFVGSSEPLARFPWVLLVHTLLGTALVASGAGTLNQVIERKFDAQMRRTSSRPIAAGRIEPIHALVFGILLSLVGCTYLALAVRPAASLLAVLTLVCYLFLYTPLKRRTPMCTLVGAFPGAMPVLIGYVAVAGKLASPAWLLYAILFLWQFPHFMAIAWMYREDYARAGYVVLPQGTEKAITFMGWQNVFASVALVLVTVAPLVLRHASPAVTGGTLLLSLSFLYFAARLAVLRSNAAARQLLLASVIYLPSIFVLQVLTKV